MKNSDQPAFPESCTQEGYKANVFSGLTKREYFLCHSTYEPSSKEIALEETRDRNRNPHNDFGKPKRRSLDEIIAELKLKKVDALLAALDNR